MGAKKNKNKEIAITYKVTGVESGFLDGKLESIEVQYLKNAANKKEGGGNHDNEKRGE